MQLEVGSLASWTSCVIKSNSRTPPSPQPNFSDQGNKAVLGVTWGVGSPFQRSGCQGIPLPKAPACEISLS